LVLGYRREQSFCFLFATIAYSGRVPAITANKNNFGVGANISMRTTKSGGAEMRVRLRFHPEQYWVVEYKSWYYFNWEYAASFIGDEDYQRAITYALALKNPRIEEIT
jgi:hypothetical protein